MEALLQRNIKELIEEHPALEGVLSGFNIACAACKLGTCRLRDIVEIHNLSLEDEEKLFRKMAGVLFPGQRVAIPKLERKPKPTKNRSSPPIRELVEEHTHIKKVIAALEKTAALPGAGLPGSREVVLRSLDFIRDYADRFHHAKEEDLLFGLFPSQSEIIQAMLREHETGRGHVRAARAAIESGNAEEAKARLLAYAELLTDHIRKEDDILYPWMDRELTDSQIGALFSQFREVGLRFGDGPGKDVEFSKSLEP